MARTRIFALLALGAMTAGCMQDHADLTAKRNPTLYSVHQPVVQRTDYVMDLSVAGNGLASGEDERLSAWFDSLDIGYGDRIFVDQSVYQDSAAREDIARVAGSYGLLLSESAPVTAGAAQPGSVRVVVSRASASVPTCPDWAYAKLPENPNTTDSNYGCATNKNLAAMIADPNDLVAGRAADGTGDAAAAIKAIRAYRDRAGSGASGTVEAVAAGGD